MLDFLRYRWREILVGEALGAPRPEVLYNKPRSDVGGGAEDLFVALAGGNGAEEPFAHSE
jgi:hypothetical protein